MQQNNHHRQTLSANEDTPKGNNWPASVLGPMVSQATILTSILKVIFEPYRTGFEDSKSFAPPPGTVIITI
jgi:hypothetical protein